MGDQAFAQAIEKTKICHIDEGFDFLGFHLRKYKGKLLIKPSKEGIKRFLADVRGQVKSLRAAKCESVIHTLNPMIRGWTNYYRHACSSKAFQYIDYRIYGLVCGWGQKLGFGICE